MITSFIPIIIFLFGLAIGSFLNALVWRIQTGKSIVLKRSQCPRCGHELSYLDLIPVFSFIFLSGKCKYCKRSISWQYPIIEIATAFLFVVFFVKASYLLEINQFLLDPLFWLNVLLQWFFIFILLGVFLYDFRYGLVPDQFTIPGIIIGLAVGFYLGVDIWNMLLALAIGGGFFLIQFLVSGGKWIGGGDIRIGALMGVILGYPNIVFALFISYFVGAFISLVLVASKKKKIKSNIPFGPFLVIGTLIVMAFADKFLEFWNYYV